jgi:hypothetical protein
MNLGIKNELYFAPKNKDIPYLLDYVETLSSDVKKSLRWYTGSDYEIFNRRLRTGSKLDEEQIIHLSNMDKAFYNSKPLSMPLTVYRGIKGKAEDLMLNDKAFISTTLSKHRTRMFRDLNCCILQITVCPGCKVLPLEKVSEESEEEVLLDRDGNLEITGTFIDENNVKVLYITYTPKKTVKVHNEQEIKKAEPIFDSDLAVERMIEYYKGEDTDFIDEDDIKITYKKMMKRDITKEILSKIKTRLKIA